MAIRIFVRLPNLDDVQYLDVNEGDLVYDGKDFVNPAKAKYVSLLHSDVAGTTIPFPDLVDLFSRVTLRLQVLDIEMTEIAEPNPNIIVVEDPADGNCVCGITCAGTRLSYVKVYPAPLTTNSI